MENIIIVVLLIIILLFALRSTWKHFRGESSCCGGSTYKARKKKLNTVNSQRTFHVEGMSCQNCVNRVMEAVNSIDGASAVVHLKKNEVVVSMEHAIDDENIINAVEKAGYHVTGTVK